MQYLKLHALVRQSLERQKNAVRIGTLEWFSNFNFVCLFESFQKA